MSIARPSCKSSANHGRSKLAFEHAIVMAQRAGMTDEEIEREPLHPSPTC
jgi:hypothetical protein